jgi:hypothetical protein
MPNSQFNSPARMESDGRIVVGGTQQVQPPASAPEVKYHFILVQGDVVAKGTGTGHGATWTGITDPGEPQLQLGRVLALGLGILATTAPSQGFLTFSWSDEIELATGPG